MKLKHPELPLQTAKYLKDRGYKFHMDIVGGGVMEQEIRELVHTLQLEDCVALVGYLKPEEVRKYMERADIFLFTSNRQEGWGAVVNESMNSGCALVSNHMVGAAPYLVRQGHNGYLYEDGREAILFETVERLVKDDSLRREIGRNAYHTITDVWNAENAAQSLMELIENVVLKNGAASEKGTSLHNLRPCAPAPVISEKQMWRKINGK